VGRRNATRRRQSPRDVAERFNATALNLADYQQHVGRISIRSFPVGESQFGAPEGSTYRFADDEHDIIEISIGHQGRYAEISIGSGRFPGQGVNLGSARWRCSLGRGMVIDGDRDILLACSTLLNIQKYRGRDLAADRSRPAGLAIHAVARRALATDARSPIRRLLRLACRRSDSCAKSIVTRNSR
jgi:hypothetical protein